MSFQKYPPDVKGNTISNLILVDSYEFDKKRKGWYEEMDCFGFTLPFNSRDIFLCIQGDHGTDNECHKAVIKTIIHESAHNILTKHIGDITSMQLDNLFYKKVLRKKLKKNLFDIIEPTAKKQKTLKNKKTYKGRKNIKSLDVDFWLSGDYK